MSTIEKTMAMLESMPEEARERVFLYAQQLFTSYMPANPHTKKTTKMILSDLETSRHEVAKGQGVSMVSALTEMGAHHGFI
jgi:hypothetical protein